MLFRIQNAYASKGCYWHMQNLAILFPFHPCLAVSVPVHGVSLDKRESTMKAGAWVGIWLSIKIQDKDESLTTDLNITCLASFGAYLLKRSSNQDVHDDNVDDRHPLAQSFYLGLAIQSWIKLRQKCARVPEYEQWHRKAARQRLQRRRTDDPPVLSVVFTKDARERSKGWWRQMRSGKDLIRHLCCTIIMSWRCECSIRAIRTW